MMDGSERDEVRYSTNVSKLRNATQHRNENENNQKPMEMMWEFFSLQSIVSNRLIQIYSLFFINKSSFLHLYLSLRKS